MAQHFDLVIVGTGSGNSILDERFDDHSVAIVERGTFGGTCLNVGCIPTKMFVHTADVADAPREGRRLGVHETLDGVDWPAIRDRIFGRIDPIAAGGRRYRIEDCPNVTVYEGTAHFTGERRLQVDLNQGGDPVTISGDQVVLATGGRPVIPHVPGIQEVPYLTSDTVMRLETLPRRMAIWGGGYISAEFAHVFSAFGVEVTILCRYPRLLRHEDDDISERFTELALKRWDVRLQRHVREVRQASTGIQVDLQAGDREEQVEVDALLIATGRRPNGDLLNLAAAGVDAAADGRILVDCYQRTSAPGVWALGDASSPYLLKHVANHEERVVQHNLLHPQQMRETDHRFVPHAVFSSPQVASIGLTEREAKARELRYVTSHQDYAGIAYGWALEDTSGFCKLIADPDTGLILGAHIVGYDASTLLQPLIQAMHFALPAREMARGQYWIHPALPELVENALLGLPLKTSP
ncbi:MAG: mycothione reductase [Candidatus Dormibacteraeota bacterium]|nr:mycothione reductase [Candidatus Dormibacteraeota bacterium]